MGIVYIDGKPYDSEQFDIDIEAYQREIEEGIGDGRLTVQFYDGVPTETHAFGEFLRNWHRKHNPHLFDEDN